MAKRKRSYSRISEMNKSEWFNIVQAKHKILKGQVYFITKLEQKLSID